MNANDRNAANRRKRAFSVLNVPMRAVLGLPFRTPLSGSLMLLNYTGRKSGKTYRQPISYVRDGNDLLTPGGGNWTLSLANGNPVNLHLQGHDVTARPELVTDPADVQRLFTVIETENPRAGRFIPIPRQANGQLEPAALQGAIDHGFCIVRWHLPAA